MSDFLYFNGKKIEIEHCNPSWRYYGSLLIKSTNLDSVGICCDDIINDLRKWLQVNCYFWYNNGKEYKYSVIIKKYKQEDIYFKFEYMLDLNRKIKMYYLYG